MTTEAAVLVGPAEVEVQTFPIPEIGQDDGLLEIEACGICGSDVKPFLEGGAPTGAPRTIDVPVILGHEMVGRIARIGSGAQARWGVEEGDRVVVERWMPCGRCSACSSGSFAQCVRYIDGKHLFYGGTPTTVRPSLWGGFARHMYLHPDTVMHRVPSDTPASPYSMFLPLANAVEWVQHTGGVGLGDSVLILGPGPIGLMCVLVARAAGARTIVVSGLTADKERLRLAQELGATETVVADGEDVAARCRELSDGVGMDLAIDATSAPSLAPVVTAVDAVRANGRVVLASEHPKPVSEQEMIQIVHRIQGKTLTVTGVRGRRRKAAGVALALLHDRGWVDTLARLCDPIVGLDEVAEGFSALLDGRGLHGSVHPGASPALRRASREQFADETRTLARADEEHANPIRT